MSDLFTKEQRVKIANKGFEYAKLISMNEAQLIIGKSCYIKGYVDAAEEANDVDTSHKKTLHTADVSGCTGIFVNVNPYNDPRWSSETGIKMKHPINTLRCYSLGGGRVSFKKPIQSNCESVVCFDKIAYGVSAREVENWDELPDLPFNPEILKDRFFSEVKVKVV